MKITLVQQHASHNREENLARGIEALKEAARRGSHLVVFPELSFQRFFPHPEYMRALALKSADLVVVPQAGAAGEWPAGVFEAELQIAAFQNGYFAALANRVGKEECLEFAGESFVSDPLGRVLGRAPAGHDFALDVDLDFSLLDQCPARRHFLTDRRPEVYPL